MTLGWLRGKGVVKCMIDATFVARDEAYRYISIYIYVNCWHRTRSTFLASELWYTSRYHTIIK
jgi:hypothetical protein